LFFVFVSIMLSAEEPRTSASVPGFELTECEVSVIRALRMTDKSEFEEAREELMRGIATDVQCVSALLLMRFLRIDHPSIFGPTDISVEDMLSHAQKAPTMERDRANKMCDFLAAELSTSPTALFLCGSLAEKVRNKVTEALEFYRKSASLGCAAAQFNIGCLYSSGIGVDVDKAEAAKWFQLAADQGRANAQNNLGVLYLTGQGVPMDRKKAADLFKEASKNGHVTARQNYLMAVRPATPLKLPTVKGYLLENPVESPREQMEPWNPSGGDDENVPLAKPTGRKRGPSFSQRFFASHR